MGELDGGLCMGGSARRTRVCLYKSDDLIIFHTRSSLNVTPKEQHDARKL